jgi:hypothetical protein
LVELYLYWNLLPRFKISRLSYAHSIRTLLLFASPGQFSSIKK